MKEYKKIIENIILIIFFIVILWTNISLVIQAFKCPSLTSTELFLSIPDTFLFNFKNCG